MRDIRGPIASTVSSGLVGTEVGQVLSHNENRAAFYIQNLNTGVLYVALGSVANATRRNIILKAGSAIDDGNGGLFYNSDYVGPVAVSGQFFGAAGLNQRYLVWELV